MIVDYPHWLKWSILLSALIHDVAIIIAGWLAFDETPRTISNALPPGMRHVWAVMMIVSGIVSVIGVVSRNNRLETTGCVFTTGSKLVWVVAALTAQTGSPGADVLAAVLVAGASGTMWRVWGLYVGQYLKIRE